MNKETQKIAEEKLKKELTELENELKTVGRINPTNPGDWEPVPDKMDVMNADSNEVADSIEQFEENAAILKQLEIRLNEIKGALERLASGKFGTCKVCGKEIEKGRIEANPAATTCQAHKETK